VAELRKIVATRADLLKGERERERERKIPPVSFVFVSSSHYFEGRTNKTFLREITKAKEKKKRNCKCIPGWWKLKVAAHTCAAL